MKKKTLATAALLSGIAVGFTSIMAIDIACKKRPKDAKKPIDEKDSQWLNQQNFEDLQINEIAKLLGIKESTVKARLSRARQKLKAKLGDDDYEK